MKIPPQTVPRSSAEATYLFQDALVWVWIVIGTSFSQSLDKLIHIVTQVHAFLGLASSGIKWQFVMGTPEGTMITLTALGVQVWDWGS